MNLREAAQQALEALIWTTGSKDFSEGGQAREGALNLLFPAITALRAALAENQSEDVLGMVEPVAWLQIGVGDHEGTVIATKTKPKTWNPAWWKFKPLYTAPPKREPLTEAELEPIRRRMMMEAYNAADDGDSERYNALKVMANDVLDMLLGGEK